ncbi:hypothetical protein AURDEDRAFT_127766 [Auricularia subglabra TFB-10046 SS5]|nr:hypothetical protein AURDEDRAFT_127766 [Auricularia subglabra TFB-10046 SS5]
MHVGATGMQRDSQTQPAEGPDLTETKSQSEIIKTSSARTSPDQRQGQQQESSAAGSPRIRKRRQPGSEQLESKSIEVSAPRTAAPNLPLTADGRLGPNGEVALWALSGGTPRVWDARRTQRR